jgi:hypothetical protein
MLRSASLLLLLLAAAAVHAQTVTLSACNAGTADVEVYFAQGANVVTQHLAPAGCATLAKSDGAMTPGLVAVGFANAQGQWSAVQRLEHLPGFGDSTAQPTTQNISVTRGSTRMSLRAQFSFNPPTPLCTNNSYREAIPGGGTVVREITNCDDFDYTLNVLAFPDTREVAFLRFCDSCDTKQEAQKTDQERARENQADDAVRALNRLIISSGALNIPVVGGVPGANANRSREESQDRYRENQEYNPTYWDRIGWQDVPRYRSQVFTDLDMVGSAAVIQGTISGVKLPNPGAESPWIDVYFREAPGHELIVCATEPGILADVFGANFATSMIGKKVEVEGLVAHCNTGTGLLVKVAHQVKLVGTGPGMVPAVNPPPFKFPN